MKHILILTCLILSCNCSDRFPTGEEVSGIIREAVIRPDGSDADERDYDFKRTGILPSRTAGYSGEDNVVFPSVRTGNQGRRVQPSGKAPFRVIKDGKVIDRHNFQTYRTDLKRFSSGPHSTDRYIHTLCQLLI